LEGCCWIVFLFYYYVIMKYKVWDRVIIKGDLSDHEKYVGWMSGYLGDVVTISIVNEVFGIYKIEEDNEIRNRYDGMFEWLVKEKEEDDPQEWDIVYVSDESEEDALEKKHMALFITKTKHGQSVCVEVWSEKNYKNWEYFSTEVRQHVIPKSKPTEEKKKRELYMTDSEREEFKKKNNF